MTFVTPGNTPSAPTSTPYTMGEQASERAWQERQSALALFLLLCLALRDGNKGGAYPHEGEEEEGGGDHEERVHTCLSERVFPFHVFIIHYELDVSSISLCDICHTWIHSISARFLAVSVGRASERAAWQARQLRVPSLRLPVCAKSRAALL